MTRIAVAIALLAGLAGEAASQSTPQGGPRLKELVSITGELVRIGDLVEHPGRAANIAVFRSPDLGQTGTVSVSRVIEALRPHDVAGLDFGGLSEVVVTRLSRAIGPKEIEERIVRALAGQHGFGDARNLQVSFDREVRIMHLEAAATADLAVARMTADPRSGRFDITFEVPGSAIARRLPLRFTGAAVETIEAATLIRAVQRGEVLRAADVVTERKTKIEAAGEGLAPEHAIGLAVKRSLRAGQLLRQSDLAKPELVQRDETVTILYEVPGIMLTMRGKALESGASGELINVLNTQSNRKVQATVTGQGRVTIAATMPQVAAVAPDPAAQSAAQ